MSQDKFVRHFSRIPFDAETHILSIDNDQRWPCTLLDISLNGALISPPEYLHTKTGDNYKLELQLGNEHDETLCLHMDVTVTRIENDHVGLQIVLMDVDTASHLHRLIELNAGDTNILERELAELIELHNNSAHKINA